MWYTEHMINIGACVVAARRRKGLKQFELARRAEMSPGQLCQIENGRVSPSFHAVERLAAALDLDVAGLIAGVGSEGACAAEAGAPPAGRASDYVPLRAVEPDALRAFRQIEAAEGEFDALEARRGVTTGCTLALNRAHLRFEGAGAALAEELRADLGLGTAPIGDLASVLAFRGVRVHRAKLPKDVGSVGFWNARRETPVVALNAGDTPERHRYRLAYELASACLYVSLGRVRLDESLAQHRFLTDFTAAFLMPGAMVRTYVAATGIGPRDWTLRALVAVKSRFGVSAESFALRLEELGLISPALRLAFRDELRARYAAHPDAMEPQPDTPLVSPWEAMREGEGEFVRPGCKSCV